MQLNRQNLVGWCGTLGIGLIFFLLAQKPYYQALNYTFVIASALLHGQLGLTYSLPWLNELIPGGNNLFYSAFPLGAVISILPFSLLKEAGFLPDYPASLVVALQAAGCFGLAYACTFLRPDFSNPKRLLLAAWLMLGTWFMTNLLFAGAWQLALGFAVLGQLGALYFSTVRPRPFLAGLCLALAFGNRTEILLIAPIILIFLLRPSWRGWAHWRQTLSRGRQTILQFSLIPTVLGLATLLYNQLRFHSWFDFGYARIPGVLDEPWYQHGIFSVHAIPLNAEQMLWQGWHTISQWPYLLPSGFGGSILLASPFLFLLLRRPRGDKLRSLTAIAALIILTFALWLHGNPGGWQYSYRYALILLPWFLLLFIEWLPPRIQRAELLLCLVSITLSAYATYLFLWSNYLH